MILNRLVLGSALVIMMTLLIAVPFNKTSDAGSSKSIEMVPNVVVIKFIEDPHVEINKLPASHTELNDLLTKHAVTSLQPLVKNNRITKSNSNIYDLSNIYYATFSGNQSPAEVAANIELSPLIEYAEPKYIHYINSIPDDSLYHFQEPYYAPQAWDIVKGENSNVIIAIVDGGTDIRHPDLADNIWRNDVELNGMAGVDDDDNGYIDDLYGWNFANESGDPTGLESTPFNADHGTLTAGIVSAVSDNLTGVSGVSWNATVMAINVSSESKDRAIAHGYDGIIYAANNGADVISCSWGAYTFYTRTGHNVMLNANSMGAVVVASAGNDNTSDLFYPAAFENVLSVAGTGTNDIKWEGSNYGRHIDLAAPAVSIYSTLADGRYGIATGTSLSVPLVSGVAGLVKAQNPGWTGMQAGEQVRVTADSIPGYAGELGRGRLNAYRAVTESSPSIHFVDYDYIDENDNRFIEPGERIEVYITLINYLAMANNIKITLSPSSDYLTMIDDEASLSSLGTLEETTLSDPFVFDVAENTPGNPLIKFDLQIEADGYRDQDRFIFEPISPKKIWTKDPNNPILSGGASGTWNRHVFMPCVLYNTDSSRYEMWFGASFGPDVQDVWRPYRIGFATSPDGISWTMHSEPVLEADTGTWDESTVEKPRVIQENGTYKMWYTGWSPKFLIFGIGYATSPDGITWTKHDTLVMGRGTASWEVRGPAHCSIMLTQGGTYKMWYTGYNSSNPISAIGYATSDDGITWTKAESVNPVLTTGSPGQWDDGRVSRPHVLFINNKYHMWYTGQRGFYSTREIGWATSVDGIHWNKYNDPNTTSMLYSDSDPVLKRSDGQWDASNLGCVTVMLEGDSLRMWYGASRNPGETNLWRIGHATAPLDSPFTDVIEDYDVAHIPEEYSLLQNYPNPFNPSTTIEFTLPKPESVKIEIYNIIGQKIETLLNKPMPAGDHRVTFNAGNFPSGIYFYRIEAGEFQDVKKMVLLK
jgi:subtilisin family serine protease/predicted GH43/DUF377 family glycosyl hydrolase